MADACQVAGEIPRSRQTGESASRCRFGMHYGRPGAFFIQGIRNVLGCRLEQDLHAKRVNSLCDATLGVLHSGSLAPEARSW
jgi:hypothetical protein